MAGNSVQMLYLLTFTEAAIVCDFTIILETIPSVIFEKRHICQCGSYPFTDCWGLKHENRFKPFTAFWISIEQCTFEDPRSKCDVKMHLAYITST